MVLGIGLLILGAQSLVLGGSSVAKRLRVSSIVIGLTIVAFGTSTPELVVNILSAINGATDLAVANVVGSNLANILLILGVGASIHALKVKQGTTYKEIPLALLAVALVAIVGNDIFFGSGTINTIGRIDGIVFLCFFIIFMYYTVGISKKHEGDTEVKKYSWLMSIGMVAAGIGLLTLGGKWIVESAIFLATAAGISQALIGITIVAVGTSLPELVTTIVAVKKGQDDLAIGNVIGSNIFNVFWILGVSSIIQPLPVSAAAHIDILATIGATCLLFLFMFIHKKHTLERWQGVTFVLLYIAYVAYLIHRG